jgi:hypothetical protein
MFIAQRSPTESSHDLISDALAFGRLWYTKSDHAVSYAKFRSRSHDAPVSI